MANLSVGNAPGSPTANRVAGQDEKKFEGVDKVASVVGQEQLAKRSPVQQRSAELPENVIPLSKEVQEAIDGLKALLSNVEEAAQTGFGNAVEGQISKVNDLKPVLALYPKDFTEAKSKELQKTELGKELLSLREKTLQECSGTLASGKAFLALFKERIQALESAREDHLFEKAFSHELVVGRSTFVRRVKDLAISDAYHGVTHELNEAKKALERCRSNNGLSPSDTSPFNSVAESTVSDALEKSRLLSGGIDSLRKEIKCFNAALLSQPVMFSNRPREVCISYLLSLSDYEAGISSLKTLRDERLLAIKKMLENKDQAAANAEQLKALTLEEKELALRLTSIESDLAKIKSDLESLKASLKVTDEDIAAAKKVEEDSKEEISHGDVVAEASDLLNSFSKLRTETTVKNALFASALEGPDVRRIDYFKKSNEFKELETKKAEFEKGALAERQKVIDASAATYQVYKDAMALRIQILEEALGSFDKEIQERTQRSFSPAALSSPKLKHVEGSPSKDQVQVAE